MKVSAHKLTVGLYNKHLSFSFLNNFQHMQTRKQDKCLRAQQGSSVKNKKKLFCIEKTVIVVTKH